MKLSEVPKRDWLKSKVLVYISSATPGIKRSYEGEVIDFKSRVCIKAAGSNYAKWVDPENVELLSHTEESGPH